MEPKVARPMLLWLDFETTGLDPEQHCVLEVGAILTDLELREWGQFHRVITPEPACVERMVDRVRLMHTANGLLAEAWDQGCALERVYEDLVVWLTEQAPGGVHLAGSCPQFEHDYLSVHMPEVLEHVHRRVVDMNTLWLLIEGDARKPEVGHRSMADLERDLELARRVRDRWFA